MLHGFLESSTMWDGFNPNGFKLILIDLPGHGRSLYNAEFHDSICKIAEEIKDILQTTHNSTYSVVGHSMGGYIAIELMKIDSFCDKLILLNSNFWKDSSEKVRDRQRVAEIVKRNKNLFITEAIPNLFQNPEKHEIQINTLIAEAKSMTWQAIAGLSIAMSKRLDNAVVVSVNQKRILIIQGANDTVIPLKIMTEAISNMTEISLEVLPSGHMAHFECPEQLEKSIISYLT